VAWKLSAHLEAWWRSGLMSLAGHLALPVSPWGVVWCYLGIVLLFNELLLTAGLAPRGCWLARAVADPRLQGLKRGWRRDLVDSRGDSVAVLDLRFFSVPLPRAFD
jgi:hypothetical protein